MSSPEKHSSKHEAQHKGGVDKHLRPLAIEVQHIMKPADGGKGGSVEHAAKQIDKKQDKLLADILNDSLSPEKRLAAVKSLVGKSGHLEVSVKDSHGQVHKLRLEVEKTGNSKEMIHVLELGGAKNQNRVFLRGNHHADGSFHKQKDRQGHEVSFAPDKLGKVEALSANNSSDSKKIASAKVQGLTPEAATNKLLGNVEISGGHRSVGTAYYPHNSLLEGGFKDKIGKPLCTLEDYLAGKVPYVSVAMDNKAGFKYGQQVRIPELEQKYGRKIPFKIVDTGGAFIGKGTGRIDICVANKEASHNPTINGNLTLQFV